MFVRAERRKKKGKAALIGPSGSGKTLSALLMARGLVGDGGTIALFDTERSSGELYASNVPGGYLHANAKDFEYETFLAAIAEATSSGVDCLVIDSVSHAWEAFLEWHDREAARMRNSFTAWAKITPKYNQLINAIVSCPIHVIVTMRSKSEYVIEDKSGRSVPRKVGTAPVMRPGSEFEFDIVGNLDLDHALHIEKTRCSAFDGKSFPMAGVELGARWRDWLNEGVEQQKQAPSAPVMTADQLQAQQAQAEPDTLREYVDQQVAAQQAEILPFQYDLDPLFADKSEQDSKAIRAYLKKAGATVDPKTGLWVSAQRIKKIDAYLAAP